MTSQFSPQSVISTIPGWEQATWTTLHGGQTNRSFLLEQNGKRAVLKIDNEKRAAPYNSRHAEREIQSVAAKNGISNRVLFASDTLYVTEYVAGDTFTADDLRDPAQLVRLANLLKRVHALPLTGRKHDGSSAASNYLASIGEADRGAAMAHKKFIDAMPPLTALCCSHNDLVAANIIATPELRLLDWEYACDNHPLFDLATIVAHHGLNKRCSDVLVSSYFGVGNEPSAAQLQRYIRFYNALRWLWTAARKSHGATD